MLSSPGIGSGLDVRSIVAQLMAVERQPILKLDVREAGLQAKISGFGQLQGAVSSFQSAMKGLSQASKFLVFDAITSKKEVLTAEASSSAANGVYSMEVKRIAENHRMAANTAYVDVTTAIGSNGDTMTLQVGSKSFKVEIGGKTLAQIRDAINSAADNTGVTASIITPDGGNRLVLSADSTGSQQALTVSYSGTDPFGFQTLNVDRDGDAAFTPTDLDAVLTMEGLYTATRSNNTIQDVIQGVTLTLEGAGTVTVSVERDMGAAKKAVEEFVSSYNKLMAVINGLREEGLSKETATLANIQSQFRQVLNTPALSGSFTSLFDVGVKSNVEIGSQSDVQGDLVLDSDAFNKAIEKEMAGVVNLFTHEDEGFASRLVALADKFLKSDGPINARTNGLKAQVKQVGERRAQLERRMESVEIRLLKQFSALDSLLGSLQTTSNYLDQQFQALQAGRN